MKYFNFFNVSILQNKQLTFFQEVSHLCTGLFSSLIKVLSVFEHNFFAFKFHLLNKASSEGLFRYCKLLQKDYLGMVSLAYFFQFPYEHFLKCCSFASSDCTEDSSLSTRVFSEDLLAFYFHFSQFLTKISSTFFQKLAIYLVIHQLLHFRCFNS